MEDAKIRKPLIDALFRGTKVIKLVSLYVLNVKSQQL